MRRDYKVSLRTEESIAALALRWRELGGTYDVDRLDVITFVKRLCRTELPNKGIPELKLFDGEADSPQAFVTFRPTCIHVESETWNYAKYGDPYSIYILAHEIGHTVMHDHHAKAFASEGVKFNMYGLEDWSAEWQANTFADYFLLPDHILAKYSSVDELVLNCGVSRSLAVKRWPKKLSRHKFGAHYIGEACQSCGNFSLVRNGTSLTCDTCGATTGCS